MAKISAKNKERATECTGERKRSAFDDLSKKKKTKGAQGSS
jgi:hypothetical protein